MSEPTLRAYLRANLFDGDESGVTTRPVALLLDDVCEEVAHWMVTQAGMDEVMERYYAAPTVRLVSAVELAAQLDGGTPQ